MSKGIKFSLSHKSFILDVWQDDHFWMTSTIYPTVSRVSISRRMKRFVGSFLY